MGRASLRIAWFSDISTGRPESLSAYCSRLLLPELSQSHTIEVFSESVSRSEFDLPHHHYLKAYQRHRAQPFDIFFYQLEDGPYARFVRGHVGLIPGVVWVHDLFCRDLGPEACHTSPWERSIRQYYDPNLPFADRSTAPHQLWPRLYRECSLSPLVLFSSTWAHAEFLRMTSNRLEAIDGGHHAETLSIPVANAGDSQASSGVFRVAYASVTGIEGRAHKLFPVLRSMRRDWKLTWMVSAEERTIAEGLAQEFGLPEAAVEICSPDSADAWSEIVMRSNVALHPHTSIYGHISPYVQISVASGVPTIVEQSGQGEDLPEEIVLRIMPGVHESEQLRQIFHALQTEQGARYGEPGRRYMEGIANPAGVARRLSELLSTWAPQVSYVMDRWSGLHLRARNALMSEVRELVGGDVAGLPHPYERIIAPMARDLGWL